MLLPKLWRQTTTGGRVVLLLYQSVHPEAAVLLLLLRITAGLLLWRQLILTARLVASQYGLKLRLLSFEFGDLFSEVEVLLGQLFALLQNF